MKTWFIKKLFSKNAFGQDVDPPSKMPPPLTPEQEIIRLKTLNEDMDHQIRELNKRRAITEKDWEVYVTKSREHSQMAIEQGLIIEYLRNTYPHDFQIGGRLHDLSFSQIVLRYLKGSN